MKGVLLKTDGTQETIELPKDWLKKAQKLIGGYIEVVKTVDNRSLLIDDEGRLKGRPINPFTSVLYSGNAIVGDAILLNIKKEELD